MPWIKSTFATDSWIIYWEMTDDEGRATLTLHPARSSQQLSKLVWEDEDMPMLQADVRGLDGQ